MLLTALILTATAPVSGCTLIRPVAPDEPAARRIAEAVIRNIPASALARSAATAGRPYQLVIQPDTDDTHLWIAFQRPRRAPPRPRSDRNVVILEFAGHGLQFRIDRCTGAVSSLFYSR